MEPVFNIVHVIYAHKNNAGCDKFPHNVPDAMWFVSDHQLDVFVQSVTPCKR